MSVFAVTVFGGNAVFGMKPSWRHFRHHPSKSPGVAAGDGVAAGVGLVTGDGVGDGVVRAFDPAAAGLGDGLPADC